jgi:hypothetical protein
MEVIRPLDGDAVTLRPCPPWCTEDRHFAGDEVIYADHGYDHYSTEIEVLTSYKFPGMTDGPATIVRAVLKSWTHPLDPDPGGRSHRAQSLDRRRGSKPTQHGRKP